MRDRLIELVKPFVSGSACEHESGSCELTNCRFCNARSLADHLIANGVTVQEWISVKDGLPKLILCDAGTAYSEAVNVLTSGRKVLTAIWDGFDWICDAEFWDAEDEEITHWTPVLLPLPQPPKGE